MAGLKPNDFHWIIEGKLAVSECIGGGGLTPPKIRREEEIQWLKGQGINAIFSLLDSTTIVNLLTPLTSVVDTFKLFMFIFLLLKIIVI